MYWINELKTDLALGMAPEGSGIRTRFWENKILWYEQWAGMDWYERWQQEWSSSQKDNVSVVNRTFYQIAPEVLDKRFLLMRWRGTRVTAAKMEDKGQIQVKELTVLVKSYTESPKI